MEKYVVLEKAIGETPLVCAEKWRSKNSEYADVPLAYAGRLDPMASGKLLILIGDECKNQTEYHGLDKAYDFTVLFGIESDSLDVLGRLTTCNLPDDLLQPTPGQELLSAVKDILGEIASSLEGSIELPYPKFSSKTVKGKPLHVWTVEGRLDEIDIPTNQSMVYSLSLHGLETISRTTLVDQALKKINTIPPVTDPRKILGNDFRRVDVRQDWEKVKEDRTLPEIYHVAHFSCIASSGTYMRSLASEIATRFGTCGLAWHIHRTVIGRYSAGEHRWISTF
jgi:tRNA pseudouridine55 synthase